MKETFIPLTGNRVTAFRSGWMREIWVPVKNNDSHSGIHFSPIACTAVDYIDDYGNKICCPYGTVGDILVFGSDWAVEDKYDIMKPIDLPEFDGSSILDMDRIALWTELGGGPLIRKKTHDAHFGFGKIRSAVHMPKSIRKRMPFLKIKDISVRRIQSISNMEARACGFRPKSSYIIAFRDWINMKYSEGWESNAWFWRIIFGNENR